MTEEKNPYDYLGLELLRDESSLMIIQKEYSKTILQKFKMEDSKSTKTPMIYDNSEDISKENKKYPYREALGSLLYLSNRTRPDITYSVNYCTRKMENPTERDIVNLKRIFKYLNTFPNYGIKYKKNGNLKELYAYCDADYAGDTIDRKSTSGFVIFYCGAPIIWISRKQPIVAMSSTEAECISAAECTKELIYIKYLIEELTGFSIKIILYVDNQSAIKIIKNGQLNKRSKHIDVRYHFINEKVNEKIINLEYCKTEYQIADIFTKPLCVNKFNKFKAELIYNI